MSINELESGLYWVKSNGKAPGSMNPIHLACFNKYDEEGNEVARDSELGNALVGHL